MAKPERRDPDKEKFWRRMVQRWQRSRWTARDFCEEHGLSEASFYAWRREIARRDQETMRDPPPQPLVATDSTESVLPVFMKVAIEEAEDVVATAPAIEVVLGPRRRLLVRAGFDADLLRQLIRLLEEPSCLVCLCRDAFSGARCRPTCARVSTR